MYMYHRKGNVKNLKGKNRSSRYSPKVKFLLDRYRFNSFRYYASKTWNELLPDHFSKFRKETSFNQFNSLMAASASVPFL
jgi:hypothetical protein